VTRVLSGAVLVALVVAVVWLAPRSVFEAGVAIVAVLALRECAALASAGALGVRQSMALVAALVGLGIVYIIIPLGTLVLTRRLAGPGGVFLLMLTVMVSDTAQYYTGRALGRRPLAPRISPKKTVEGAIGGFVFGTLLFVVVGAWWTPQIPTAVRVAAGPAIVAFGIAGDLFESMLKRSAGVKDSSALIPGHGGVLDRVDALLFAAPVYYVVLKWVA
jgi:phosphatidate cytidylyltransferase